MTECRSFPPLRSSGRPRPVAFLARTLVVLAALAALGGCRQPLPAAQPAALRERPPLDAGAEALELLQAYLRIDTTNPPGNEMLAARFLKGVLDRDGVENQLFDLGENRAVLYAVLRGTGAHKPLILLHHLDVVPAEAEHWSVPPFSGEVVNQEVYGRGAVDIKGKGIIDLVTLLRLAREHTPLRRDLILLAVADEEGGSLGSRWMVETQPALIRDAEFLLDEGGSIIIDEARRAVAYVVSFGEKAPLWLSVTFSGPAGHGSVPIADSAVDKAVRAALRIMDYRTALPRVAGPELEGWLRLLLSGEDVSRFPGYAGDLATSLASHDFLAAISLIHPEIDAALRNTVSVTGLRGSDSFNVIPNEASIQLDCRLLPGTTAADFIAELEKVVADPSAVFKVHEYTETRQSSTTSALLVALGRVAERRDPGTPVVPTLLLSSTDASYDRRLGIQAYGFEPYRLTSAEADLSHGNDERMSLANLAYGVELLTELVVELSR